MTGMIERPERRDLLLAALALAGGALGSGGAAHAAGAPDDAAADPVFAAHARDWDWLVGRWSVSHSRLKARLAGDTEWEAFAGTCANWPLLGGRGNVDDNLLHLPAGPYRGVGLRAFDAATRQWSIWWLDSRNAGKIDPPVRGGFADGVGVFVGDDTFNGRPIKVRFRWSKITPTSAHWDQAFSPNAGATWETNWRMDFTRLA
jgi:hypothetical protein